MGDVQIIEALVAKSLFFHVREIELEPTIHGCDLKLSLGVQLLSIVIPVHNESEVIYHFIEELKEVMTRHGDDWEVVVVDDASTDSTAEQLRAVSRDVPIRIVSLSTRSGQSAALWAGFTLSNGDLFVTMDGDGQNDPNDIPKMIKALKDADMVVGNRHRRRDSLEKLLFSKLGNCFRNLVTGSQLPDSGCGLKVFQRASLRCLVPVHGMHRFMPTMIEIFGGRVISIDVNHRLRRGGKSKYGIFDRFFLSLLDCMTLAWLKRRRLATSTDFVCLRRCPNDRVPERN